MYYTDSKLKSYYRINNLPIKKIWYGLILVFIYFLLFAPISYLPANSIIKYISILIVGLFVVSNYKIIFQKKYFSLNIFLLLFVLWGFITSICNHHTISTRNPVLASIVYFGLLMETLFSMEIINEKYKSGFILKIFYFLTLALIIVTDLLIIFQPSLYYQYGSNYLVGSKFKVSYLHSQLLVLLLTKQKICGGNKKLFYFAIILYSVLIIFISFYVDCMTGILLFFFFVIIYLLFSKAKKLLAHPLLAVFILLFFTFFVFFSDELLKNNFLQDFILNVLNRDLSLTGRMFIYAKLPELMSGHWILGYGYGSVYEICIRTIGYANTQNGIFNWLLQMGIPSVILLFIIIYISFRKTKYFVNDIYPVIVLLYCFNIISAIEVCIDEQYLFWIFFLYIVSSDRKKTSIK